jgi:hypothetical protein
MQFDESQPTLRSSGSKSKTRKNQHEAGCNQSLAYSLNMKMEKYDPPKRQFAFKGLYDVMPHKIEIFIDTAVIASNLTQLKRSWK